MNDEVAVTTLTTKLTWKITQPKKATYVVKDRKPALCSLAN